MDPRVVVYRTQYCPYCTMAERLLSQKGIPFTEVDVSSDPERRRWLVAATGQRTVPQVFINGRSIGGFQELSGISRRGELEALLAAAPAEAHDQAAAQEHAQAAAQERESPLTPTVE